jgi:hypothetical protein
MNAIVERNVSHFDGEIFAGPNPQPGWWRAARDGSNVRHDSAGDPGVGELTHFDEHAELLDADAHRKNMIKRMNLDSRSYGGTNRENVHLERAKFELGYQTVVREG